MNIIEKLKTLGVEVTPEIEKALGGDFISKEELDKKIGKIEWERDKYKQDYETAKATLDGFEGKDFDAIQKERDEWKQKAEEKEKEYAAQLEHRDYMDKLKELTKDLKFSSNSAKKAFMADLESNPLQMRNGTVLGFEDYLKQYRENDASAFISEQEEEKAQFTTPAGEAGAPGTKDPSKMSFQEYEAWRKSNQ